MPRYSFTAVYRVPTMKFLPESRTVAARPVTVLRYTAVYREISIPRYTYRDIFSYRDSPIRPSSTNAFFEHTLSLKRKKGAEILRFDSTLKIGRLISQSTFSDFSLLKNRYTAYYPGELIPETLWCISYSILRRHLSNYSILNDIYFLVQTNYISLKLVAFKADKYSFNNSTSGCL